MNPKIEPLPSADPRETNNTAERNELRRRESWSFIPGVVGLVILAVFAFVLFSGDRTPTPDRATSSRTDVK
jgi:hypothetical protein